MDEVQKAKEKFYQFFAGVAGLRFTGREEFDDVVDALIKASQFCICVPVGNKKLEIHPNCPIHKGVLDEG
jgi:hypothetical protein